MSAPEAAAPVLEYAIGPEVGGRVRAALPAIEAHLKSIGANPVDFETMRISLTEPENVDLCQGRYVPHNVFSAKGCVYVFLRKGAQIQAMGNFIIGSATHIYLDQLCARKDAKGSGGRILDIVEEIARALSLASVKLVANVESPDSRDSKKLVEYYQSRGYTIKNSNYSSSLSPILQKLVGGGSRHRKKNRRTHKNCRRRRSTR